MRILTFAKRTWLEMMRDPLTLIFGLGFPGVLIIFLSAIQINIPVPIFEIEKLAPGMIVFGFSFMTLFTASVIAKDRESTLLQRLYATPMKGFEFILGYTLPLLPMAILQTIFCFIVGAFFKLQWTVNLLLSCVISIPIACIFIGLGLLFGSIFSQKQVGGICGALLTNLTAFLSGIWFDLEMVGKTFQSIANVFPFVHAVKLEQLVYTGNFVGFWTHFAWIIGYAIVVFALAIFAFLRQMQKE